MKRLFLVLLLLWFAAPALAQTQKKFVLNSSTQTGPRIDLVGTGTVYHRFSWNTEGTVSAGTCSLVGGTDGASYPTTVISAQTVTTTGAFTDLLTSTAVNYVRITCAAPNTPIAGSGKVTFLYNGSPTGVATNLVLQGTSPWAVSCTSGNCTTRIVDSNGNPILNTDTATVNVAASAAALGWDSFNATAADSATACTNSAQAVKASAGNFGGYYYNNPNTADSWIQVYNVAAGSVTVGTTVPKLTFRIPGTAANSVAANVVLLPGIYFDTAISIACTSTAATNAAPVVALENLFFFK